ncbi:hypothetical protein GQ42DRAFT_162425 [Ramicandelaber brevisporus]|nr:hypothetical protein GQ42DRAFT_162425 [Ramicandelaber brevisporus]
MSTLKAPASFAAIAAKAPVTTSGVGTAVPLTPISPNSSSDASVSGAGLTSSSALDLGIDHHADSDAVQLVIRALISTKEAGVVIGKQGKHVADIRREAQVRAGVSKAVPNINDRIFTVIGPAENVAMAYAFVAQALIDNPITSSPPLLHALAAAANSQGHVLPITTATLRLLISHNLMGNVIGKSGARIKQIQEQSGARMVTTKELLPQSTERIVEIHGTAECVRMAVEQICKCIAEDPDKGLGTVIYNPNGKAPQVSLSTNPYVAARGMGSGSAARRMSLSHPQASTSADAIADYEHDQHEKEVEAAELEDGELQPLPSSISSGGAQHRRTSSAGGPSPRRSYSLSQKFSPWQYHQEMMAAQAAAAASGSGGSGSTTASQHGGGSSSMYHSSEKRASFMGGAVPRRPSTSQYDLDTLAALSNYGGSGSAPGVSASGSAGSGSGGGGGRMRSMSTTIAATPYGNVVGALTGSLAQHAAIQQHQQHQHNAAAVAAAAAAAMAVNTSMPSLTGSLNSAGASSSDVSGGIGYSRYSTSAAPGPGRKASNSISFTSGIMHPMSATTTAAPGLGFAQTSGYYAPIAPTLIPSAVAGMPPPGPSAGGMQSVIMPQDIRTQEISIPEDLVGCIIGKGGQRIAEIRRQSGARILIDKAPEHNANGSSDSVGGESSDKAEDGSHNHAGSGGRSRADGERLFTLSGTSDAIERALYLLYAQLDAERTRRLHATSTSFTNIPAPGLTAPSEVNTAAPAAAAAAPPAITAQV